MESHISPSTGTDTKQCVKKCSRCVNCTSNGPGLYRWPYTVIGNLTRAISKDSTSSYLAHLPPTPLSDINVCVCCLPSCRRRFLFFWGVFSGLGKWNSKTRGYEENKAKSKNAPTVVWSWEWHASALQSSANDRGSDDRWWLRER